MIQKATELGVTKFLPIITDRTIVRKINYERIEKIIIEASEQSNRIKVPKVEKTQNLNSFLEKNNCILLERSELTSGSSWHAAGNVHVISSDPNISRLMAYTINLYKEIEKTSGQSV